MTGRRENTTSVGTWEDARRHTARRGLRMTPAERLRWLEETVAELEPLVGRVRADQTTDGGTGMRHLEDDV